jgi:hypothetical protein
MRVLRALSAPLTNGHTGPSSGRAAKGFLAGFGGIFGWLIAAAHADQAGRQEKDDRPSALAGVETILVRP